MIIVLLFFGCSRKNVIDLMNEPEGNTAQNALFSISPLNGRTDTLFSFDASTVSDTEDPTANLQVHWDFNGDGVWDTAWSTIKTATTTYPAAGTFSVNPLTGNPGTVFNFDASAVSDTEVTTALLQVRWDFNGDASDGDIIITAAAGT